jgi:hypothetical protein
MPSSLTCSGDPYAAQSQCLFDAVGGDLDGGAPSPYVSGSLTPLLEVRHEATYLGAICFVHASSRDWW